MGTANRHSRRIILGVKLSVRQQAQEKALHVLGHGRGGSRLQKLRRVVAHCKSPIHFRIELVASLSTSSALTRTALALSHCTWVNTA